MRRTMRNPTASSSCAILSLIVLLVTSTATTRTSTAFVFTKSTIRKPLFGSSLTQLQLSATSHLSESSSTRKKNHDPFVEALKSEQEYFNFIGADDNSKQLCVIKFHAAWCKSCQKFGLKYSHEAKIHQEDSSNTGPTAVRFGSLEHGANVKLCKKIGIKRLPTVHFYYNGELINGFSCGPSKFSLFQGVLQKYLQMSHEELMFEKEMNEGEELMTDIANATTMTAKTSAAARNNKKSVVDSPAYLEDLQRRTAALLEKVQEQQITADKEKPKRKSWWNAKP